MLPNLNDVALREYQIVSVGHAGMHKAGCSEETRLACMDVTVCLGTLSSSSTNNDHTKTDQNYEDQSNEQPLQRAPSVRWVCRVARW